MQQWLELRRGVERAGAAVLSDGDRVALERRTVAAWKRGV